MLFPQALHPLIVVGTTIAFLHIAVSLTLYVTPDSHAEKYAKERGITYEYLAEGKTVQLDVVGEDGNPLDEEDYSIRWYENGERLSASGGSIGVDADTQALTYEIALGEELAFQYQTPAAQTVELTGTVTALECQLQPLPQVTLTGAVTDAEGEPLPQASVTISQSAGIYEKTQRENLPGEQRWELFHPVARSRNHCHRRNGRLLHPQPHRFAVGRGGHL